MKLTLTNLVIGALVAYVVYIMFFRREGLSNETGGKILGFGVLGGVIFLFLMLGLITVFVVKTS